MMVRKYGILREMINDLIEKSDFLLGKNLIGQIKEIQNKDVNTISRMISASENCPEEHSS